MRFSFYRALLAFYPAAFRHEYGGPMELAFEEQLRHSNNRTRLWLEATRDALTIAPREHAHMIGQNIRYAFRTMAASPQFALAAILSLGLGIGANTALYSVWDTILHASLPVRDPGQLVMLTNPQAQGMINGQTGGERAFLTNAEFESLRDRAGSFAELMAVQSNLDRRPVRFSGAAQEEARMRLVSAEYFRVLGVHPKLGHFFTGGDDPRKQPYAVISDRYWQTRFDRSSAVIDKSFTIRNAALTIIGVAPPGFFGESRGQQPDMWIPISMQPQIIPGRDWLHDRGMDKVMWLHSFGRLKPGVTVAQAQAEANAIFKQDLETQYGALALSAATKAGVMDQRLHLQFAPDGTTTMRANVADPLQVLLVSVGVVLLIACANLASLLLARGASRRAEIALRLSLGASHARLVRQLLTESIVLATLGGMAGLALSYVFHALLMRLATAAEPDLYLDYQLNARVVLFTFAITGAAALLFGMLPAWITTRSGAALRIHGQASISANSGHTGRIHWGRALVVAQLALSLPLVAAAGLFARTAYNLQKADLGYAKDQLLELNVDAASAGYEEHRHEALFARVLEQIRRTPGVLSATYANNGIFTGGDSSDEIAVEGYTRKGTGNDQGSREEIVGPGYFATLGIPILLGRAFNDSDTSAAPRVCVINEAFAKLFFAGRNPLGLQVTHVYGDERLVYRVVGVSKNSRNNTVNEKVEQRFYVPSSQPMFASNSMKFLFRTARAPGTMFAAAERAIHTIDPSLPVGDTRTVAERIEAQLAGDRITALLAAIFGLVALLLAVAGLYGVLAHGVARRKGEIAIRIAIGARPAQVIAMFLRETGMIVALGLAAGAALTYAALRLIANQFYGLAPNDPPTLTAAALILVAAALTASLLPARRAARLDPMAALRQE